MMEWIMRDGGIWVIEDWPYKVEPVVKKTLAGEFEWWLNKNGEAFNSGRHGKEPSIQVAKVNAFDAAISAVTPSLSLLDDLRRELSADLNAMVFDGLGLAFDTEWVVTDVVGSGQKAHAAVICGHKCLVIEHRDGRATWELEPEFYGHPCTWDTRSVEVAKVQVAGAALQNPCKRWIVTLKDFGTSEIEAVSKEGALYKAACKVGIASFLAGSIEGEAVEV